MPPRTRRLPIALSDDEWTRIEQAARRVSPSLTASAWVRDVALRATAASEPKPIRRERRHYRCICGQETTVTADRGAPIDSVWRVAKRDLGCSCPEPPRLMGVEEVVEKPRVVPTVCARCGDGVARHDDTGCTVPGCACRRFTLEVDGG
jgi:hypothetical protein